jgi:hypothetical protein
LLTGAPSASAAPNDPKQVSQNSVVKTSPDVLVYDNMFVDVPKSAILTITNVSGQDISVTPFLDFGSEYAAFLTFDLALCESGKCLPVTSTTKTDIPKDGSEELTVTVKLIGELPKDLKVLSVKNGLQITGEVLGSEEKTVIVPQNKEVPLADTGVSPSIFTVMGLAGLLAMIGYGLLGFAQKKKAKNEETV